MALREPLSFLIVISFITFKGKGGINDKHKKYFRVILERLKPIRTLLAKILCFGLSLFFTELISFLVRYGLTSYISLTVMLDEPDGSEF